MGGASNRYERDENCKQNILLENLKGTDYLENLGVHERVILNIILKK
jgi:hypothetical protein